MAPWGRDRRRDGIDNDDPRRTGLGAGPVEGAGVVDTDWGAYGSRYYRQKDGASHWVVRITKGDDAWMFSDAPMDLFDGTVHPMLLTDINLESSIDLVTKEFSIQDVDFEIADAPYRAGPTGAGICFSDEIGDLTNAVVSIYILAGVYPTALSAGKLKFRGVIGEAPVITGNSVSCTATDSAKRRSVVLPRHYITDSGNLPLSFRRRKRPLVYGKFNCAYDSSSDLGLVRAELLRISQTPKFIVADHPCFSLTAAFVKHEELPHPSILINPVLAANDDGVVDPNAAGLATIVATGSADAYLYVTGQYQGNATDGDGQDGQCIVIDAEQAGDLDLTSYASVRDAITGSIVRTRAYFSWPDYDPTDSNFLNKIGKIIGFLSAGSYYLGLQWRIVMPDISGSGYISLLNAGGTLVTDRAITSDVEDATYFTLTTSAWDSKIAWHLQSGRNDNLSGDQPIVAVLKMDTTKTPNTAGREVFRVKYIRLVIRYQPKYISGPRPMGRWAFGPVGRPGYVLPQIGLGIDSVLPLFAEVEGRMFGSWIDEAGRSNSYDEGDVIADPVFIIESILRDELGFTSGDIDVASFDAAANSSVRARLHINSDNEGDAFAFIRQLAEQSTFVFLISETSKARIVNLKDASPTIKRTLNFSDLGEDTKNLQYSKRSRILNDIPIRHRWMGQYQDFLSFDTYANSTSQSNVGLFSQPFEWPNITVDLVDSLFEVANFIKTKWSVERIIVRGNCPGPRNYDLDIGDWVGIDAESVDPQKLCYGESWSGKKFIITRVRHNGEGTSFEAVNLA